MRIEEQVCKTELALRLEEAGIKKPSVFFWKNAMLTAYEWQMQDWWLDDVDFDADDAASNDYSRTRKVGMQCVHAYSAAELWEMMPAYLNVGGYSCELTIIRSSVWRFYYGDPSKIPEAVYFTAHTDDTEADARARFVLYLIEKGIIQV